MEPVTRNVTSYYYEPVTEYKYSTYYDPCTGCPQKVCTPCTSYRLRSKCNSVTSYVERCAMVPVTTLKPVTVQQPVVSYYYPPLPAAVPADVPPAASRRSRPGGPRVDELRDEPAERRCRHGRLGSIPPMNVPTQPDGDVVPAAEHEREAPPGEDRQPQQRRVGPR